ncbi:MAG TPA: NUDIX domain-containing protein [Edaphobacter sp.]
MKREYPAAPMVGVAAVVVQGDEVLLVRRGREPLRGRWSLPGGLLELGEITAEGVAREVLEETGIRVRPVEIVTTIDRILRDDDGRVRYHYVLVEWLCFVDDERALVCGDDADEAAWVKRSEIFSAKLELEQPTLSVIEKALKLAETMRR